MRYNDVDCQLIKDDDVLLIYDGPEPTLENVRCNKDFVMIKLPPKEDASLSGIILKTAESKESKPCYGIVEKVSMCVHVYVSIYLSI